MSRYRRALGVLVAAIALGAASGVPIFAKPAGEGRHSGARTVIYRPDGRRVGSIERTGIRAWNASDGCSTEIWMDRKGGYGIIEGNRPFAFAWPQPPGQRNTYAVMTDRGKRTGWTLRRVDRYRWDVFRDGRRLAYTRGPDGAAAGFAYAVVDPDCLLG